MKMDDDKIMSHEPLQEDFVEKQYTVLVLELDEYINFNFFFPITFLIRPN